MKYKYFKEISMQFAYILDKIEEDAKRASSHKVELLNLSDVIFDD